MSSVEKEVASLHRDLVTNYSKGYVSPLDIVLGLGSILMVIEEQALPRDKEYLIERYVDPIDRLYLGGM